MNGWLKLHRSLIDCPIFANEKLLKVWVWCLLKASSKDRTIMIGSNTVSIKKGQFVFGRKTASNELGISESTVYRLMQSLVSNGSITMDSSNKFSIVSIVNWDCYQVPDNVVDSKKTTDEPKKTRKKKETEPRKKYGEFQNVLLTDSQLEKLKAEVPNYEKYIDKISYWQENTGRSYKNYYSAIKDWHKRDNEKSGTTQSVQVQQPKVSF